MNIKNEINKVLENEQVLQANEVEIEQQLLEEELGEE